MAITPNRTTVGTSATKIAENTAVGGTSDVATVSVVVKNMTRTAPIVLGDNSVTTANGFTWDPADGPLSIELEAGESLWGIVAATPQNVETLKAGR